MGSTQFGKAGVNGTTALSGIAGVSGVANNDGVAVMGVANNVETNPAAIFGVDHGGFSSGVMGTADNSMGVIGTTTSGAEAGVDGEVSASGAVAVLANSFAGTGAILRTYQASSPGLLVQNAANGGAGDPILVAANPNKDVMSVDEAGNLIVSGSVTAHGTPLLVRQSAFGQPVVSYAASTTSPVIEDFGHAQLAYGTAYVSIDRGFAAAVDPRGSFAVFITPNGESRGLYVTGKSLNGFYVRENSGGRSSVGFDYRIVARPNGEKPLRLPSALGMPLVTPGAGRALQLRDLIARENQRFARLQKELNAARAQALELANASKAALAREEKEYPR
jgi:hypothetical protein